MAKKINLALLALFIGITAQTAFAQMPPAAGPTTVGTITLSPQQVPMTLNLSGVAVASESAQIRPLVQGVVREILYHPGQQMKVGDPMFQIDATSYQAAVAVATANVNSAQAARDDAQANADRYGALAGTGVSRAEAQSAQNALLQAEAAVAVAQAQLQAAQFDLDNTTIKSPIEGQAAVPGISVGDLVTSGQATALTTVTRLDPIYADLVDTSAQMLRLRAMFEDGSLQRGNSLRVELAWKTAKPSRVRAAWFRLAIRFRPAPAPSMFA